MKKIAIWFLKVVNGIDVDSLSASLDRANEEKVCLQTSLTNAIAEKESLMISLENLRTSLDYANEDNTNLQASLANATSENENLRTSLNHANEDNAILQASLANATSENESLMISLNHANEDNANLQALLTNATSENGNLRTSLNHANEDNTNLQASLANATSENENLRTSLNHANEDNAILQASLANATSENESLMISLNHANEDNANLQALLTNATSENGNLRTSLNHANEDKANLQASLANANSENESLMMSLDYANEDNATLQASLANATSENESLIISLNHANEDKANLQASLAIANAEVEKLKEKAVPKQKDEDLDEIENLDRQLKSLQQQYQKAIEEIRLQKAKISNLESTINNLKVEFRKKTVSEKGNSDESNERSVNNGCPLVSGPEEPTLTKENPLVENDKGQLLDSAKRTIDVVIDLDNNKEILANHFFNQPESVIFKMRTELEKAIYLHRPMYVCKYCGQMVKISGRKTERGMARFFSHLRDSEDCDYKTTTGKTEREINRGRFARCNEGERHKRLKEQIAKYLELTDGVTSVKTENTVKGNHPILRWRRPDVIAEYRGHELVFELQLSTTFVSVIAERDLFYRMNKKHIIWISNFDEQGEHVDLTNMMVKDIYYNNRMNIFIFDSDAQNKSEESGELILKCNWLTPDESWKYHNGNTSDELGGEFVRLSDLTYDDMFKPYYVDAEQAYFAAHPDYKRKVVSIEEENERIIHELDRRWEEENSHKEVEQQKKEERIREIIEENEIDGVVRPTKKHIIAQRLGFWGLITYDGQIRIPFIYNEIKPHRGWYEGNNNGTLDVFDSNYELKETGIRRIENLDNNTMKYVKVNGDYLLYGIMGNNARVITQAIYSSVGVWDSGKYIAVHDGLYSILDEEGHVIIDGYDYISGLDSEGKATINIDGQEGHINSECQPIYTNTERIANNLAKINKFGKWGLEDNNGNILVPCEYDDLGSFNNGVIGLTGFHFTRLDINVNSDCPLRVKYVSRNDRKMLIFKVGKREAFMNLRQQQKATKKGLKPTELTHMFISHANVEKNLLYLSVAPVKEYVETKDSDFPVGQILKGRVIHLDKNSFIIKSEEGQTAFVHSSTLEGHSIEDFNKGQMVQVEKTGFDNIHKKHIWKIMP